MFHLQIPSLPVILQSMCICKEYLNLLLPKFTSTADGDSIVLRADFEYVLENLIIAKSKVCDSSYAASTALMFSA